MMLQDVFQWLETQPKNEIENLYHHIEARYLQSSPKLPRIPNLHPSGWMSDDFADPLPDEFWENDDDILTRSGG